MSTRISHIVLILACASCSQSTPVPPPTTLDPSPTLRQLPFAPGRDAALVRRSLSGTHSAQMLTENASASFVLELAADGTATACRGWRYHSQNDGPRGHTTLRFDEQQGYVGRRRVLGTVEEVELVADDAPCPRIRNADTELVRSSSVHLRCVLVSPTGHPFLTTTALMCRWHDVMTDEARAHLVPDVAPGEWMVLGPGNGIRFAVTGPASGARRAPPTAVTAEIPDAPITFDAWNQ